MGYIWTESAPVDVPSKSMEGDMVQLQKVVGGV